MDKALRLIKMRKIRQKILQRKAVEHECVLYVART